jgi:hypothetical protein
MAILYIQTSVQAGIIGMSVTCGACRGTGKIVKVWGIGAQINCFLIGYIIFILLYSDIWTFLLLMLLSYC